MNNCFHSCSKLLMLLLLLIVWLILSMKGYGQSVKNYHPPDFETLFAQEKGTFANLNSMRHQPGTLVGVEGWKLGLGHKAIVAGLDLYQLHLNCFYGKENQCWLFSWQKEGNNELKFTQFSISSARKITEKLFIGVLMGGIQTKPLSYKTTTDLTFKVGWTWRPATQLVLSSSFENLLPGSNATRLAYAIHSSICIYPTPDFQIKLCNTLTENIQAQVFAGVAYHTRHLYVQVAASILEPVVMAATGLSLKQCTIEVQTKVHQQLGLTPGLTLHFVPAAGREKNKQKELL